MSASTAAAPLAADKIPVLLLKTKSTPTDGYEEYFHAAGDGHFDPVFVPVLEHRFRDDALKRLSADVAHGGFSGEPGRAKYGAVIFTSQRAVEAFTHVVQDLRREKRDVDALLPPTLPFYVVGPATARGLRAIGLQCPILGEESGNGEVLARFILDHYSNLLVPAGGGGRNAKLPVLFLVGEQRRDIIPKTLQAPGLPAERRAQVDEVVVYETGEMQSFREDFAAVVARNRAAGVAQQWVVVFSPTGGRAMLETLGLLDDGADKTVLQREDGGSTHIATIGPTTRDYLAKFGYAPDVCARKPSPEGVGNGIEDFMNGFAAN
ncbi:putative uroporphyrinogen-iii synthase protein [Neofusicoccum parvum UCRNP2]|uniref:Putative uroporphyrinogen-iii synthase protein n=1 Tax=Botryosphaeria parva (strain UCR-NP2) TaxID=1287680 RepID=R1EEU5_BOTPV|nr:putative uroporphyrinogen-iii synthase protein [Neofusicoccum parvum UCRNP2]